MGNKNFNQLICKELISRHFISITLKKHEPKKNYMEYKILMMGILNVKTIVKISSLLVLNIPHFLGLYYFKIIIMSS